MQRHPPRIQASSENSKQLVVDQTRLGKTVVTHGTTDMAGMENPAKSFGGGIGNIDGSMNVDHFDDATGAPFLNSKVLDVDMARAFGRAVFVDHGDGSLIVFVKRSRAGLWVAELGEDSTKIFGDFGGMDSSNEFSLGG